MNRDFGVHLDNILESSNPFSAVKSGYGRCISDIFVSAYPEGSLAQLFHKYAHDYVVRLVKGETFPCILGQTATKTNQYSFCAYDNITDPQVAEGVLYDIVRFQHDFEVPAKPKGPRGIFRAVLAAFQGPEIKDEIHGAEVLYTLLNNMHEINSQHYEWTEGFSNNPQSPDFGFSAGESAYFIAYLHPKASVPARRSGVNFIVFNSHHVIEAFKATGMDNYAKAKSIIRGRQVQPIHPYLGDHGAVEEWRQYALLNPDPETEAEELELRKRILGDPPFQPKRNQK